jgi:hypothetical protein
MAARYCAKCDIGYPPGQRVRIEGEADGWAYMRCPLCGRKTIYETLRKALPEDEARLLIHEVLYKRHDEAREQRGEPSPDDIGREEGAAFALTLKQIADLPEVIFEETEPV